jgi:GT2 family glycosyltransferase
VTPRLSVVVATCDRPAVLSRTLEALTPDFQQVAPDVFEVIVADDSQDESTRTVVEERFPQAVYVKGPGRGPASNRNRGAAEAKGEWLAFIDDDCQPAGGWARALLQQADEPGIDVVEGRIFVPDKMDSPFRRHVENLTGGNFWSGNLAVRRATFARLGRFDEEFLEAGGEDLEFGERIRRSGVRTAFCPAATVIHPSHVVSWRYLFWRTFLIKWHLLYLLKTGQGVPADAPVWKALGFLLVSRTRSLLRTTWRLFRPAKDGHRSGLFDVVASWVMFPMVLPYLVYWEVRFRRHLRAR